MYRRTSAVVRKCRGRQNGAWRRAGGVTPLLPRNSKSGRGDWIRTSDPLPPKSHLLRLSVTLCKTETSKWLIHRWIWRCDPLSWRVSDRVMGSALLAQLAAETASARGRTRLFILRGRFHSPRRRTNFRGSAFIADCRCRASTLRIASSTASSSLPTSSARKRRTK